MGFIQPKRRKGQLCNALLTLPRFGGESVGLHTRYPYSYKINRISALYLNECSSQLAISYFLFLPGKKCRYVGKPSWGKRWHCPQAQIYQTLKSLGNGLHTKHFQRHNGPRVLIDYLTCVISPALALALEIEFHLHWLQIWPPDGAICIRGRGWARRGRRAVAASSPGFATSRIQS